MKKFVYTALFAGCFATAVLAATVTVSPNTNNGNGGNIPSGYKDLIFTITNTDWAPFLKLPKTGVDGAEITIRSTADFSSASLDTSNTDIPQTSIGINNGSSITFVFNSSKQLWQLTSKTVFGPKANGDTVPAFEGRIGKYVIKDGDWTAKISLPATATDQQYILIQSDATKASRIDPANILFPSTFTLNKEDRYFFQYNANLKQWVSLNPIPTRIINVANSNIAQLNNALAQLTAPKTEVRIADDARVSNVTLPQSANDRDRIIFNSTAAWQTTIDNTNTNTTATMKLNAGDHYEFMYVADQATWVLMSSPRPVIKANDVTTKLTQLKTPVTEITADNDSWNASVTLPANAQNNDKVVVTSDADRLFTVTGDALSQAIHKGDTYRFVYNNGAWQVDTVQMDMLLVNSPEVDDSLGAVAAKLKIREGLRITNVGLDNSQAKAYFREVGYLDYKIPAKTLQDTLAVGRADKTVQNEADRTGADAIHYQGLEPDPVGCGWAAVNRTPNKLTMISSANIYCGSYTISHEIGHNLGLRHSFQRALDEAQWDKDVAAGIKREPLDYNYGFEKSNLVGTFLSYFNLPQMVAYYSSPKVYEPKYGIRLGEENKIDEVRVINENAPVIANFRAAVN